MQLWPHCCLVDTSTEGGWSSRAATTNSGTSMVANAGEHGPTVSRKPSFLAHWRKIRRLSQRSHRRVWRGWLARLIHRVDRIGAEDDDCFIVSGPGSVDPEAVRPPKCRWCGKPEAKRPAWYPQGLLTPRKANFKWIEGPCRPVALTEGSYACCRRQATYCDWAPPRTSPDYAHPNPSVRLGVSLR